MALTGHVLLWAVDADTVAPDVLERHAAWMGTSERERCMRFVRPERQRQFIVGRALLRRALAGLLKTEPAAIGLAERPGLAPALLMVADVGFSISHSGRWVACAAGAGISLGLDIERTDRERDFMSLAEHAFSVEEVAILRDSEPACRQAAFYRMWCAHEARIKLGCASVVEYPVALPGLAGVLACTQTLETAPVLTQLRLDCM
ncbi:4'-phosphopantetheinyl transferase superfamily protein [Massilia sp. CFBP9012]|uniref:4'-phosphopantetheinyl transferase family protein n=1 Tax=Massilia sp. CFBP9012 TaxID=3096531 RepID=UPI002A6B7659|nr:4'-phosphopantetheinyl transferase superfamily protein [Massilia sp. CFBP9012]MDY0973652.1 4'-phosphopantetheinyl transferase superfamily protein [Massilia sp. CFBP9012]